MHNTGNDELMVFLYNARIYILDDVLTFGDGLTLTGIATGQYDSLTFDCDNGLINEQYGDKGIVASMEIGGDNEKVR